ncbi:hypothetical protein JCM30471_32770 [Desulfuromonas carbonis]|uniref:hypothetical protein n=1 Tax=Desulfuromonas sp. DDH964 TaxID=1823759 RepID=UPI00078E7925|nr:hypothetical protein [Desulfuromonas sp. DDH964]AMV71438.1 hypothetical protein DBW_1059 [Desulfuromonas sp. DDH964]
MAEPRPCAICGAPFTPAPPASPAEEAGAYVALERYGDAGALCRDCLASRGTLAMMYCPEFGEG